MLLSESKLEKLLVSRKKKCGFCFKELKPPHIGRKKWCDATCRSRYKQTFGTGQWKFRKERLTRNANRKKMQEAVKGHPKLSKLKND